MTIRKDDIAILGVSTLFVLVNAFLATRNIFLLNILPLLGIGLLFLLFSVRQLFFLVAILAPLSVPLYRIVPGLSFDFWFPTEPIIFCLLLVLILKSIHEKYFDFALAQHPIFWSLIFYLGWIGICIVPSELPIVSAKYLLTRVWFIGVFFYLGYIIFKSDIKYFKIFLWCFVAGLFIVSAITLIRHIGLGIFNQKAAHGACTPFFIDHTSYGATLAFIIPISLALAVNAKSLKRIIFLLLTLFFTVALVFSYSRAAWLSLLIAGMVWIVWIFRMKFSTVLIGSIATIGFFLIFQFEIRQWLSSNTSDSSGNLKEHLNSAMNVTTDASNLERINRWSAAIRMFEDKPIFGHGPGTYMFLYAPFQRSYQRTIISTNFGTGGNAHSEYLGLLADTGFLGMVGYILILVILFYRGFCISRKVKHKQAQVLLMGALLGLITYFIHGFMNNFLDMDKIALPFWSFAAFIVALDIKMKEEDQGLEKFESKN